MNTVTMPFWKRAMAAALAATLAIGLCPTAALAEEPVSEGSPATEAPAVSDTENATEADEAAKADTDVAAPPIDSTPIDGVATPPVDTPGTSTPGANEGTPTTPKPPATKPVEQPKKPVVEFKTAGKLAGGKWQKTKVGSLVGATVTTSPLAAMKIYNKSKNIKGSITYRVYMAGKGWGKTVKNGTTAGNGTSKNAIQAIKIKLTGDLAKQYNVYYRVYLTGLGWTGWGTNGAKVGAPRLAKVKAYQMKLVKKSDKKTNKKYNTKKNQNTALVTTKSGTEMSQQMTMAAKSQGQTSSTKWLILVDTNQNRVCVLKGKKGDWNVYKYFKCTSGAAGSPTVRGKFTIGSRGLSFGEDKGYSCWYWTQFYGNYLFHSVLYYPGSQRSIQDGRLGINASHGCVRLAIGNAKWINRNIPSGTKVWTY